MHHLPDGPQVFTSYTISGDVSPPWCKCIVCHACVQPVNRSWLHVCLQSASKCCTLLTLTILSFAPSALCLHSGFARAWLSLLSRGEGGVTRKTLIVRSWGQTKKWKKNKTEHFKKKKIHVIWPWRRIKKTTAKEIFSVKALERDKHGGYETCSSRWEPWNSSFRRRNWEIITLYIYIFNVQKTDMLTDGLVWRALSARPSKTFHETRCQEVWNAAHVHARYGCQARFVS